MKNIVPMVRFSGGEISPLLYNRVDLETYYAACKQMVNFIPMQYGPAKRRSGLRFVNECKYGDKPVRLIPFVFSTVQAYVLEFGHKYMRVHKEKGTVLTDGGEIFEIATPYDADDLAQLQYTQSADYLFLVHPKYAARELTRTGHNKWKLAPIDFNPTTKPVKPTLNSFSADKQKTEYTYGITFVYESGMESEVSEGAAIIAPYIINHENKIVITGRTAYADMKYMKIYRNINGIWCYTGRSKLAETVIGPQAGMGGNGETVYTYVYIFEDNGTYTPDYTHNPPEYTVDFGTAEEESVSTDEPRKFPTTVTFDNQRLIFGGSEKYPNTIWGSYVRNYRNFATYNTPTSMTPYEYPLATDQVNEIRWMRSTSRLLIGTSGAEWRLTDVRANEPYDGKRSTQIGSARVHALGVNRNTLFVNRVGRAVYAFSYTYRLSDYQAEDLSIFAEHLTRSRSIKDWAYASIPYNVVWCVCDDGVVINMVYNPDNEIVAWAHTVTKGKFQAVATIPSAREDHTYFVVERNINGTQKQYVEMLEEDFSIDELNEAFFVDSGITIKIENSSEPTNDDGTTITGLEHLEGETVSILMDGAVHPDTTVAGGCVKLQRRPEKIIHMGLGYQSLLETMEIEANPQDTSQSLTRKIQEIVIRYERTVGGEIGTGDGGRLLMIPFRKATKDPQVVTPLYEGLKSIRPIAGYTDSPSVIIVQNQPLPMTIIGMYPKISIKER